LLKVTRLPVEVDGFIWSLNAITGSLLKVSATDHILYECENQIVPTKVKEALRYCSNPYDLVPPVRTSLEPHVPEISLSQLQRYKARLQLLKDKWLFFSLWYAGISSPIFEKTGDAIESISQLYNYSVGSECLQRTLLAAKTSASFLNNGVIFIGANIPTGHMHSWIIEGDYQPDVLDRHWISYQPILAIHGSPNEN